MTKALLCLEPGCGRISRTGPRCPEHQRLHDLAREQQRGTRHQRGYDSAWTKLAREVVAEHPWCTDCGTLGDPTNPLCGDHAVPLAQGGTSVRENVAVRCRRCNSRKGGR